MSDQCAFSVLNGNGASASAAPILMASMIEMIDQPPISSAKKQLLYYDEL
jgi:hypothetical protein